MGRDGVWRGNLTLAGKWLQSGLWLIYLSHIYIVHKIAIVSNKGKEEI